MSIDTDIELIDNAESGETVRGAIIRVIQDLNQNGGNAQTLNGHDSDAFTKKSEFDKFVDDEVGQIHQVLDAINKGTTLKVIDLGEHTLETSGGHIDITVPRSISDRSLLSVDDFYADIVSVAGGNGANASWTKSATYDPVQGIYHYNYGAVASEITLHFYVKRASAIAVTDYDVHHLTNDITSNGPYAAPAGEAWDFVNVQVPTGSKTETTLNAVINNHTYEQPQQSTETWNKVIVDVPGPELQTGSVSVTENNYHNTFSPAQGKDGFSSFEVDVNIPFNTQSKNVDVNAIDFSEIVQPGPGYAGLSEVRITSSLELEDPITVRQNGPVSLSYGKVGFSEVTVAVPVPVVETGRSVTYSSGGTYTVNPTGNNDAMDSVEVTVQTPRLQPSKSVTLSQSGTVTPDSDYDAMEEVVVTVSGGGGGNWTETDQATWDAMSYEAKKLQGPTVIKNTEHQTSGYWIDLSVAILMILGEYCNKIPEVAVVPKQKYAHLIYFQSKWNYNSGWDNSVINHSNISYNSMSSGNETISNGAGGAITNKMLAILHDVTAGDNAEITFSIGAGGYDIDDAAFAVAIPFNSEVDILAEHFSSSSETIDTSYTLVTPVGSEDPSTEGWYEIINDVYTLTADTTVNSGKTYYRYTNSDYDYVLIMATKWRYGQTSSNGTYSISSGTLVQNGDMTITIDGADKSALALYSDVRSGTTITLGNLLNGSKDSVVVMGINEIFASLYLPYSSLSNIICEAHIDNFDPTAFTWGNGNNPLTLTNLLTANGDGKGVDVNGKAQQDYVYCDLGSTNTNFTAYLVFKYTVEYGYGRVISTSYQQTTGEAAYIAEDGLTMLRGGLWGSDPRFGEAHTIGSYIVVAMRNNNKTMSFFKNGSKGEDKTANNVSRYVALATDYPNGNAYGTNITVAYAGVVNEAESDNVILQNINNLMTTFNIS